MLRYLLPVLVVLVSTAAHSQLLISDDFGRKLVLRKPATRIVTLAPSLTEAAFGAGAGDLVIGVDSLSDYPPSVAQLPRIPVGSSSSTDAVAALNPDLVLAWADGTRPEDVERMTKAGATVYLVKSRHLEDVPRLLTAIGQLTGRDTARVVHAFEKRITELLKENSQKPKLSVFLEVWNRPLTTVAGDNVLNEALAVCRGDNVFVGIGGNRPIMRWDEVQAANPYLVVGVNSESNAEEFRANWSLHPTIPAVQAERLLYIDSDALQRPTVRTADAIASLCAQMDQVRVKAGLIPASAALQYAPTPDLVAHEASPVMRRPMTAEERELARHVAATLHGSVDSPVSAFRAAPDALSPQPDALAAEASKPEAPPPAAPQAAAPAPVPAPAAVPAPAPAPAAAPEAEHPKHKWPSQYGM
jgi:iron complex transport system substrate-binding protein